MNRENTLAVRLTKAERQLVEAMADREKLPASTFARRWLLLEAEQRGIVPQQARGLDDFTEMVSAPNGNGAGVRQDPATATL